LGESGARVRGMGVVTISATYGSGGGEIGRAVATGLDLPFYDQAIPADVARRLGVPLPDAESKDETFDVGLWRVLSSMALAPDLAGAGPLAFATISDERAFRDQTEQVIIEVAAGAGGVILGRAGAFVLPRDAPEALHVRLDGPEEARLAVLARLFPAEAEGTLRHRLRGNDGVRAAYVRRFYRADPAHCQHYHLVVDSTALPWDVVGTMVVAAARARGIGGRPA